MSGRITTLCTSARKGERKTPVQAARFVMNHGIEGDAHAGTWHRQISLLSLADVDATRAAGLPDIKPGDFAENVVVSGIELSELGLGSRLRLGSTAELTITQIGKTCHSPCEIYHQTGDCIMPRLGLFAQVSHGGEVAHGDAVEVLEVVPRDRWQAVVLVASDRCERGETVDTAGPAVARLLEERMGAHVYTRELLPDDRAQLADRMRHYADGHSIDLIAVVGGTGFAPRDVTPEAVGDVIERATPGLDEAMRQASAARTPHAMLSRARSGIRGATLIVSLPGSERGATENFETLLPALPHGLKKLRGDPSDCGRPEAAS